MVELPRNSPVIGSRCEIKCLVNGVSMDVLLDTGSPTSLVSAEIAQRHSWTTYSVPPLRWKGALTSATSATSTAVGCRLEYKGIEVTFAAYVTPDLNERVILGYPVLEKHPELLVKQQTGAKSVEISQEVFGIDTLCEGQDSVLDLYKDIEEIYVVTTQVPQADDSFAKLPVSIRRKFKDTVTDELSPQSGTKTYTHDIELKEGAKPPRLHPYRLTPKLEKACREIIDGLLKNGFIVESKSPVSSPMLLVKKKDGTYRLVVDYRELNKATIKDPFPLPRIDDLMAKIGDCSIFTTLDLHSGYHQIPLAEDSEELTAFSTPFGHYHYKVMPFGLCNAPATFSRYMNRLFGDMPHVFVYLDDILIASKDRQTHLQDLDRVLSVLQKEGLVCKKSKCHFMKDSVEFLGHRLSAKGFSVLQDKVRAVQELPTPKDVKACQSFLGLINYYRSFIPRCSALAKPLTEFISGKCEWGSKQDQAVATLKKKLTTAPVLIPFEPGQKYRLTTDASTVALGAVLERLDGNKVKGVVGYFSKSVNPTQARYPIGEIELLAIIEALSHFRYYLHGNHFILRTDHISLLSLRNKKEPSKRLARWLDFLAEYDFTLEYIKGTNNVVADALSRPTSVAAIEISALRSLETFNPTEWMDLWLKDPWSAAVLRRLGIVTEDNVDASDRSLYDKYWKRLQQSSKYLGHYSFHDDILYYDSRVCVPREKRPLLLHTYHDSLLQGGHFGETATTNKLLPIYYWPSMSKDIKTFIATCIQCQIMKSYRPRSQGLLQPLDVPDGRWLDISIDFVSGLPVTRSGYDMIMVVVDRFSKRAHFIATRKKSLSIHAIEMLYRYIFAYHGFPRTIVSDRDVRFTSKAYKELTQRLGIKLLMSSANHPQTDGQTESVNKVLIRLLRSYCSIDWDSWDRFLPQVEFVYNSTFNAATQSTPFEVDLGYIPNEPLLDTSNELSVRSQSQYDLVEHLKAITLQVKDQLAKRQVDMQVQSNAHQRLVRFEVGEMVLLHRDAYFTGGAYLKIQPIYLGPFKVVKVINDNAYELDLPSSVRKHRVINVQFLKKLHKRPAGQYPKKLPATSQERINRCLEITQVIGYDANAQIFYCKMRDVDPDLTCSYTLDEFNRLPPPRRKALLQNFTQLVGTSLEEEDVTIEQ